MQLERGGGCAGGGWGLNGRFVSFILGGVRFGAARGVGCPWLGGGVEETLVLFRPDPTLYPKLALSV